MASKVKRDPEQDEAEEEEAVLVTPAAKKVKSNANKGESIFSLGTDEVVYSP
jgi:hypothetical protein